MSLLDYAQGRDLLNQALARSSASGALASRKAALRLHQIASRTFANALRYEGHCVFHLGTASVNGLYAIEHGDGPL